MPADIMWENMSVSYASRVIRQAFTWLCTLILLLLSATVIYLMQNAERRASTTLQECGNLTAACAALQDGEYMALASCFADGRDSGQRAFLNTTTGVNWIVECARVKCYECHCGAAPAGGPGFLTTATCRPYLAGLAKDSVVRCRPPAQSPDGPARRPHRGCPYAVMRRATAAERAYARSTR
jgi:hypothetical protein